MDTEPYYQQLQSINQMLHQCPEGTERNELISLKQNIEELLSLTVEKSSSSLDSKHYTIDDEYALFMAEVSKDGALKTHQYIKEEALNGKSFKELEGKKVRAPHKHQYGQIVYHNAMVCYVPEKISSNEFEVRVLFLNPTHQEMLPCPYYFDLEKDCKFTEDKCRYSHGELVLFSSLKEYIEPKFDLLTIGSNVLAKQSNNLWYRAKIKHISKEKCMVKFDVSNKNCEEIMLEHILPLESRDDVSENSDLSDEEECLKAENDEEIVNMSLMNAPGDQALGDWEKHTKGIGSKLMQKMGYIVGSGLGKDCAGRINPVTALILPPGKSLDYCMKLKEKHGNDQNLFSADRKFKRLQKRQEAANQKAYARNREKNDVFSFINSSLNEVGKSDIQEKINKNKFRESLKAESEKGLNVANFVVEENIKKCERSIEEYKLALTRHKDINSQSHKKLRERINDKQNELKSMKARAISIKTEQQLRTDKKKMTIF